MAKTRSDFFDDIRKARPDYTEKETQNLIESMKTYCEIIIEIYLDEIAHNEPIQHE